MRVAVIVDDLDPNRRRRCFWEEQFESMRDVQYELVSLLENMEKREFFNVYDYDVIIFNWCVLDGALMYASDRVQEIVTFYDDHFFRFVRRGGIIIMENQPKRWRPVQKAYDILLNGGVTVVSRDTYFFGSKIVVNKRFKRHPLLQHLPEVMYSAYTHPPDESWFPPGSTSARSIEELNPTKVYSGAFRAWKSEWLPLVYSDESRYPIMLVRTEGLGLWIVTTMFLASSNIKELVDSLVAGSGRHIVEIRKFHEHQKFVRKFELVRASLIVCVVGVVVYIILATKLIVADVPYGQTVAGNAVFAVLITLAISAFTVLRKYIWQSLRSGFNK